MTMKTENSLPRRSMEELGVSPQKVMDFLTYLKAHSIEIHSFMLLRHGQVAAEGWWHPYRPELPHMLFSLSKSFTSTAIGMAVQEGLLNTEDSVISLFPDDLPEEISPYLSAMTIRHLLMMGTGHAEDTMNMLRFGGDDNWARAFLKLPVEHEPGTYFLYNTGATYMLSAILQKVTGQTLLEFLTPRLFEPLGINNPAWESDPRGINTGGYGLKITTEDIAKFGQLYLQKGVWNGKRLMEESWVDTATSSQISNGDGGDSDWTQGYGYQFWRCRHGVYRGDGAFGQFCIVLEPFDAVIAITSGTNDMQEILNGVWEHLRDAFAAGGADKSTSETLQQHLDQLQLESPAKLEKSGLEGIIDRLSYTLAANKLGLTSIGFQFDEASLTLSIGHTAGEDCLEAGRLSWRHGLMALGGSEEQLAASFTWEADDLLLLTIRRIETPFSHVVKIRFLEDGMEMRHRVNVSFGEIHEDLLLGKLSS